MDNSYKGKIIISGPDSSGDIFSRSVVLIIEHNEDGAFGLILNKKNQDLSHKLPGIIGRQLDIYEGGPVGRDQMFFIIEGTKKISDNFVDIDGRFYMTADMEKVVESIVDNRLATENVKAFAGYSGWASQQLETEISNNYWTVLDINNLRYTEPNDQQLWKNLMKSLGGQFLLWVNTPEDVHQN